MSIDLLKRDISTYAVRRMDSRLASRAGFNTTPNISVTATNSPELEAEVEYDADNELIVPDEPDYWVPGDPVGSKGIAPG